MNDWLLPLLRECLALADDEVCNEDHDAFDGCEACAWDALLTPVPKALKQRAYLGGAS